MTGKRKLLPKEARVITRIFSGDLVIFSKASWYNRLDDYRGSHNCMSTDDFRKEIEGLLVKHGEEFKELPPERAIKNKKG